MWSSPDSGGIYQQQQQQQPPVEVNNTWNDHNTKHWSETVEKVNTMAAVVGKYSIANTVISRCSKYLTFWFSSNIGHWF